MIGAGQAGLSVGYYLKRAGLVPGRDWVMLDRNPGPGGAWQHRWPSLTLTTINGVHDLPGHGMAQLLGTDLDPHVRAAEVIPDYFGAYEDVIGAGVQRPVDVTSVVRDGEGFRVTSSAGTWWAAGIVNATGTWDRPYLPYYPGSETFEGRHLHTRDYRVPEEFAGQSVLVVGGGISAVELLEEISHHARTTWVTRRPAPFSDVPFAPEIGREAVAQVERRVRRGEPPGSIVSATGLPWSQQWAEAHARGVFTRYPMMKRIGPEGIEWADGTRATVDAIVWCTGFRPDIRQLRGLGLRHERGGILMDGALATRVAVDHRIHLPGYGPSASTIGANRAGRVVVRELLDTIL